MAKVSHAQEPSMEEILASIRRIISDEETGAKPAAPLAAVNPAAPADRPAGDIAAPESLKGASDSPAVRSADGPLAVAAPAVRPKADVEEDVLVLSESQIAAVTLPADDRDLDIGFADTPPPAQAATPPETLKVEIAPPPPVPAAAAPAAEKEPPAKPAAPPPRPVSPPPAGETPRVPPFVEAAARITDRSRPPEGAVVREPLLSERSDEAVNSAFNHLAHTILSANARTLEDLVKDMMRPMLKSWLDDNLPGLVERLVREEIERVSRGRR